MIQAAYGHVQTAASQGAHRFLNRLWGAPQCSECYAYDGWHYGDCPEWHAIVMKQMEGK